MSSGAKFPGITLLLVVMLLGIALPAHADTEADRQFTFAARLMQQGEPDLAAEAFEEFVRDFPDDRRISDVRYYQALLARREGDRDQARRHLDRVDQLHQVRPASLHLLRGQLALEADDADAAIDALERIDADELDGSEARASYHYLLATAYRDGGDLVAAAERFDRASETDSAVRAVALLELGKTRLELDEQTPALEALRSAIEDDALPADQAAEARHLAASIAYEQQHYAMAIEYFEQITRRHRRSDHHRPALIGLLRSLAAADRNEQVLERYEDHQTDYAADDQAQALYLAAAAHVRLAQHEQARSKLEDFDQRYGDDHPLADRAAHLRAVSLYRTDIDAFEQWLAAAESDRPGLTERPELRYLRAQAAVRRDRPEDALAHLTPLIDADGEYARRALQQRADLYRQLNRHAEAADDYAAIARRLQADGADAADIVDALGRAIDLAHRAGQLANVPDLAAAYLDHAADDDYAEDRARVRLRAAAALIRLGQTDDALDQLDALLDDPPADQQVAAIGHYYRGLLLAHRANRDDDDATADAAVDALQRALDGPLGDRQRAEAIDLLARMHRIAGREAEALDLYDELRRERSLDDFDPLAALWIGRGLHERGSHEAALEWLNVVIERGGDEPRARAEALYRSGLALVELGDHEAAVDRFREVVARGDGYGNRGRLGLARALAATGETDAALNEYEGLLHVDASQIAAAALVESAAEHVRLAEQLQRAGDDSAADAELTEARRRLNRAVILYDLPELEPLPRVARLRLGQVLAMQDRRDDARDRLRTLADASDAGPFGELARAEMELMEGLRSDGVGRLRSVYRDAELAEAVDEARRRLEALGESP